VLSSLKKLMIAVAASVTLLGVPVVASASVQESPGATYDGYVAAGYTALSGISATMSVPPSSGAYQWLGMESSAPGNAVGFVQAGSGFIGECWATSNVLNDEPQGAPGPSPSDCAVGHHITVSLTAPIGGKSTASFTDMNTGDKWSITIPVEQATETEAQYLVEASDPLGPYPLHTTLTFASCAVTLSSGISGYGYTPPVFTFLGFTFTLPPGFHFPFPFPIPIPIPVPVAPVLPPTGSPLYGHHPVAEYNGTPGVSVSPVSSSSGFTVSS
jgi:hypothetical protein